MSRKERSVSKRLGMLEDERLKLIKMTLEHRAMLDAILEAVDIAGVIEDRAGELLKDMLKIDS